ncbi:ABC transporter ATP-binding protein [Sulfurimonas sp.]
MIELKNITVVHNGVKLFENFSLRVEKGERVVLFAKSGSGKTTLLRLVAGLESMDAGQIYIDGILVTDAQKIIVEPHKREVGMVFQDLALWPHLNVEENIELALKVRNIPKQVRQSKVEAMLQKIELQNAATKQIDQLSGGEQQRVALARTLIVQPKTVLMDEPLSSLDESLNRFLRQEILRLQEEYGFTLLYVTHNKEEAADIAQRTIRL